MDKLTADQRRRCMQGNRRTGTRPEELMKEILKGFEYQPDLPGHPDFADRGRMTVIFIDGCFWHGCPDHFKMPKTNRDYWSSKIRRNRERDAEVDGIYSSMGWHAARIYEHELKGRSALEIGAVVDRILRNIK